MVVRASFIGIDRYRDSTIRDLGGAKRDATALWALFCDSIPDIQATHLTDEKATAEAIRRTLDDTLGVAGPEDTVIISFAGHGSKSHRLVAHDTTLSDFAMTTLAMEELAQRFRESKAKFVLCILDCCFSGGATARVFEDGPIPRDVDISLDALVEGKGRVLIAASNTHESAYEHPASRHGLFTKALLDVFQDTESAIDIPTAMSKIMERVRAETGRMGVVQTPVFFGQVEGGMTLPPLRPGPRFREAFPEIHGLQVGRAIPELAAFGLPEDVLQGWASRYRNGLNDLQLEAVNNYRVLDGESLLVVAPTSSGKTFVGEMAAARAVADGRKAVFLLPYRALVSEKYEQFQALYEQEAGMRVIRCTGDYLDQTDRFVRGKYDLALLTYEMFLALAVSNTATLTQIGLIVVDEAQFVTDPNRGIVVELLLTLLIAAREKGISPQIVALSAVIGGINHFDAWLGCASLVTNKRPVKLVEGVIDRMGVFQYRDDEGNDQTQQLLPREVIRQRRDKPGAQDVVVPLVRQLIAQGEKVIVFRNQRGKAQGCARYLANDLGLPSATDTLRVLPTSDPSSTSADLRACLEGGTAFHNTNLNRDERRTVEQAFRDPDSKVRVLGATTTVAAGINTPASTVIIAEQEFIGDDGRRFTVAEYKNMAGRAGRLGFQEEGKSIIYAETSLQREQLFARYVAGEVEPMRSSFEVENIETWILRLLAQVPRLPKDDLATLLASTYGGYLANRQHPEWRNGVKRRLEQLLEEMLALDLIEQDGDHIQLTLLGHACGRSALSYTSAIRLVELLKAFPCENLTSERLMALIQALPESDGGYTPLMKRGRSESARPPAAAARYGMEVVRLLQRRIQDEWDYLGRCKRACILGDWVDGVPIESIEKQYTPNPFQGAIGHGDIRKFADATRFHLRAAHQIVSIMYIDNSISEGAIEALLKRLEVGLPETALGLLTIPMSLSRGEYMALLGTGITTPEALWAAPDTVLAAVGAERAAQLAALRPQV